MSVHYIVDGYNVIHKMHKLEGKSLQYARDYFLAFLSNARPQGSLQNEVTVVFDAKGDVFYPWRNPSDIRVIFSSGKSADEEIEILVQKASNRKRVIVVTDDKALRFAVSGIGADYISVREFLQRAKNRSGAKILRKRNKHGLSEEETLNITREFENIWL
ncbi:MAG: NYN domain-containing protein [bacterium]